MASSDPDGRQEVAQVILERIVCWVDVDGLGHTIVTFHDTKLEIGRSGVDDEYPHSTVLAPVEHVGFAASSIAPEELA